MASVLQRFEQRLEGAVTGLFTRAFRSAVQPVEIAAALQREVDNNANIITRERILVPNDFTVFLSPTDYSRMTPFGTTLAAELGQLVAEHISEQRYTTTGDIAIRFTEDADLRTGRFTVTSTNNAHVQPVAGQRMTDTAAVKAGVVLEIGGMRHPVNPPGITIGRGSAADLKIDDPGISRQHAEIRVTHQGLVPHVTVSDLGSTNGTFLNGHRVDSAEVPDGSEIKLGNTLMKVHIVTGSTEGTCR